MTRNDNDERDAIVVLFDILPSPNYEYEGLVIYVFRCYRKYEYEQENRCQSMEEKGGGSRRDYAVQS